MSSNELSVEMDSCIRTFKEHMHLELEPPKIPGVMGGKRGATSPKLSPRSSPRLFRKLMVNKSIRQRRRFTVAHTCLCTRSRFMTTPITPIIIITRHSNPLTATFMIKHPSARQ